MSNFNTKMHKIQFRLGLWKAREGRRRGWAGMDDVQDFELATGVERGMVRGEGRQGEGRKVFWLQQFSIYTLGIWAYDHQYRVGQIGEPHLVHFYGLNNNKYGRKMVVSDTFWPTLYLQFNCIAKCHSNQMSSMHTIAVSDTNTSYSAQMCSKFFWSEFWDSAAILHS